MSFGERSRELSEELESLRARARTDGASARSEVDSRVREARDPSAQGDLAGALLRLSIVVQHQSGPAEAAEVLREAIELARADRDPLTLLHALVEIGRAHAMRGEFGPALDAMREGVELARALDVPLVEAKLLMAVGFAHAQQDQPLPYYEYTRDALTILRAVGDPQTTALALCNMGGALSRMKSYDEALACYAEGLPIALAIGWQRGHALFLAGIGGVHCERGELDEGERHYHESNALLEALGDPFQITRHELIVGRHLVAAGHAERAHEPLARAIALAERHGFEGALCELHELRARAYELASDHERALRSLRDHLQLRQKLADQRTEERLRELRAQHRVEALRRDADAERKRAAELSEANDALRAALEQQRALQEQLERLAHTDALTGLANRRQMLARIRSETARSVRTGRPLALALLDVDHFKSVNDRFGHAVGDDVLVDIATRLSRAVRTEDAIARWGGEELCVLFVESAIEGAVAAAERLRLAVARTPVPTRHGPLVVTVSIGVAALAGGEEDIDRTLARADIALYRAKSAGRNRVVRG